MKEDGMPTTNLTPAERFFARRKFEPVEPTLKVYLQALQSVREQWRTSHPVYLRASVERVLFDAHRWPLWDALYDLHFSKKSQAGGISNVNLTEAETKIDNSIDLAIKSLEKMLKNEKQVSWPQETLGQQDDLLKKYFDIDHDTRKVLAKRSTGSPLESPSVG